MAKSHYHCYNESNVDSSHQDTRHHTVKLKRRSRNTPNVYIFNVLLFVMIKFCGNQYWVLERNCLIRCFMRSVYLVAVCQLSGESRLPPQRIAAWRGRNLDQSGQRGSFVMLKLANIVLMRFSVMIYSEKALPNLSTSNQFWLNDFMYSKVKC